MLFDRRPYYVVGFAAGLLLVVLIWLSPKTTPEQQVTKDIAILAKEPWDSVRVQDIRFEGPANRPTNVFVHGHRPNGTPVLVQFAPDSPYTAQSAVAKLRGEDRDHVAEILMIPRSLVLSEFRDRFRRDATHAGIAYFGGVQWEESEGDGEMEPVGGDASRPASEADGSASETMVPASTDS
jgi:hypothetical protein